MRAHGFVFLLSFLFILSSCQNTGDDDIGDDDSSGADDDDDIGGGDDDDDDAGAGPPTLSVAWTLEDSACAPDGRGEPKGVEVMPDGTAWVGIASAEARRACYLHLDTDGAVLEELEQDGLALASLHAAPGGELWVVSFGADNGVVYELRGTSFVSIRGYTDDVGVSSDGFGGLAVSGDGGDILVAYRYFDYDADHSECGVQRWDWDGAWGNVVADDTYWVAGHEYNACLPRALAMADDGSAILVMLAYDYTQEDTDGWGTVRIASIPPGGAAPTEYATIEHERIDDALVDRLVRLPGGDLLLATEHRDYYDAGYDQSHWRSRLYRIPADGSAPQELGSDADRHIFDVGPGDGLAEAVIRFGQESQAAPVTVRWYGGGDPTAAADSEAEVGEATNVVDMAVSEERIWLLVATEDWEDGWRVVGLDR